MSLSVSFLLRLSVFSTAALILGCQDPEGFRQTADAGLGAGSGGRLGTGGASGTGGSGTGGFIGSGGSGTGGLIGSGSGGSGTGGSGTGGRATGGSAGSGTGGRASGGSGTGGRSTGGGGGSIGTGGVGGTGTGPCTGLCDNPIVIPAVLYSSGNLGTGATCHETTASIQGGNCSNIPIPRTFSVNGTQVPCPGNWPTLPARKNGGYCFQASAGSPNFASFVTF